jgi:hypothetical protein
MKQHKEVPMSKRNEKKQFSFSAQHLSPGKAEAADVRILQALLGRYGYLAGHYTPGEYDLATKRAVCQYQTFYRIYPKEDGCCDEQTITHLNNPRCGVPDPDLSHRGSNGRLAPFVTVGAKWQKTALTYKFLNATPDLLVTRQREIIREAFRRWDDVCGLTFTEAQSGVTQDLSIAFHAGSHGDGEAFDAGGGPDGNTLAHAFFPPPAGGSWAGTLHFDEFETWKDQPSGSGIRLYNVALHEIGHLLGLSHSQDNNAIMFAYYGEDRNDLRPDDIAGIQSLYGASAAAPVAITPGQQISGHLAATGAEMRYQVTLQNKLLIQLAGPAGQDFDLYVRYGQPAGTKSGQYDAVSYGATANELVTIPAPKAGTYYVLVKSYKGLGSYTLEVDVA